MFGWFKKSKNNLVVQKAQTRIIVNPGNYPAKILLAWSKAVEGNQDILKWLGENGYKELTLSCWAINLDEEARSWLMSNGYPHLMAFINAAEGNIKAQHWLEKHNFMVYLHMAKAIDGDAESYRWLNKNSNQEVFMLTKSIEKVKDSIEERHNDIHKFGDWS